MWAWITIRRRLPSKASGVSHQVIVNLIAQTTTKTGLKVHAELDHNTYPKDIKVTDAQIASLNICLDPFHGEWNYSILPSLRGIT
jgi:hypothetical protein